MTMIILNCDKGGEYIKINQQRYQTAINFNMLSNNLLTRHFNHAPQFPFGFQPLQAIMMNDDEY